MKPTPNSRRRGRTVRRLREARGLSIRALAGDAGMTPAYLSELERGHRNPKVVETMLPLAEALGLTLWELMIACEEETEEVGGERRLTPREFREHFGHLPTDGED
ncbi:MAG: helix-turn-helix domain-containing protein [Solirubrobacteraceae bacterium]